MIATILLTVIASFLITLLIRNFAIKHHQLDIPNARSSHQRPTPRGAGAAIVVVFIIGLLVLTVSDKFDLDNFQTIAIPGLLVALIGYLDDHGKVIAARWRLVAHFTAAVVAVYLLGGLPIMPIFGATLNLGQVGNVFAVVYLVWMLNLFNFMDGIDSITGIETLTTCLTLAIFIFIKTESELWRVPVLLSAAVAGFLYFNLPPAKIFLGDVGSGFIGFTIGTISLVIAKTEPLHTWALIILLGVFIVDATVTLIRRLIDRKHAYIAHRTHAYQHLATNSGRHLTVSLGIAAINIFWLAPVAWLVTDEKLQPVIGVAVAYTPLIILAIYLKAGKQKIN